MERKIVIPSMAGVYLSPKSCPDSFPRDKKVGEVRVTRPLNFLGEISPRYIKCVLCPKPAGSRSVSQVETPLL